MDCSDCVRLSDQLAESERNYASLRGLVSAKAGITRADEFRRLKEASERCRLEWERATQALAHHRKSHSDLRIRQEGAPSA